MNDIPQNAFDRVKHLVTGQLQQYHLQTSAPIANYLAALNTQDNEVLRSAVNRLQQRLRHFDAMNQALTQGTAADFRAQFNQISVEMDGETLHDDLQTVIAQTNYPRPLPEPLRQLEQLSEFCDRTEELIDVQVMLPQAQQNYRNDIRQLRTAVDNFHQGLHHTADFLRRRNEGLSYFLSTSALQLAAKKESAERELALFTTREKLAYQAKGREKNQELRSLRDEVNTLKATHSQQREAAELIRDSMDRLRSEVDTLHSAIQDSQKTAQQYQAELDHQKELQKQLTDLEKSRSAMESKLQKDLKDKGKDVSGSKMIVSFYAHQTQINYLNDARELLKLVGENTGQLIEALKVTGWYDGKTADHITPKQQTLRDSFDRLTAIFPKIMPNPQKAAKLLSDSNSCKKISSTFPFHPVDGLNKWFRQEWNCSIDEKLQKEIEEIRTQAGEFSDKYDMSFTDLNLQVITAIADFETNINALKQEILPREQLSALETKVKNSQQAVKANQTQLETFCKDWCKEHGMKPGTQPRQLLSALQEKLFAANATQQKTQQLLSQKESRLQHLESEVTSQYSDQAIQAREDKLRTTSELATATWNEANQVIQWAANKDAELTRIQNLRYQVTNQQPLDWSVHTPFRDTAAAYLSSLNKHLDDLTGSHSNSDAFCQMKSQLERTLVVLRDPTSKTREQLSAMNSLHDRAWDYLSAKKKQLRPFPSKMRKLRMDFARQIMDETQRITRQYATTMDATQADVTEFLNSQPVVEQHLLTDVLGHDPLEPQQLQAELQRTYHQDPLPHLPNDNAPANQPEPPVVH